MYGPPVYPDPARQDRTLLIVVLVVIVVGVVILEVVIAAAFLFVATPTGSREPRYLEASVGHSYDGSTWMVTIIGVAGGLTTTLVNLTIQNGDGAIVFGPRALASLTYSRDRAVYSGSGGTAISPGDVLLLSAIAYPTGYRIQFAESRGVLWTSTLW